MVHGQCHFCAMMISAFVRESGLPVDTVRLYVRRGLLRPKTGQKGGSRPYLQFSKADLQTAQVIRIARAQGLSLDEIGSFLGGRSTADVGAAELLTFLEGQRGRLVEKMIQTQELIDYLDAKMAWLRDSGRGSKPQFPFQ